jgi:riboflavin synthase
MFTGIIQHIGMVVTVERQAADSRLVVDVGSLAGGLKAGDSVAVSGVCLTAASLEGQAAAFDVVSETLSRTSLGRVFAGAKVNLELPLALGGRLDGHLVQGHVDGLARLEQVGRALTGLWQFGCDAALAAQMAPKGSVALDGVSLTLVDVLPSGFTVALIPTTLAKTTLGQLRRGDMVNVETDILGKYVQRYLQALAGGDEGLTVEKLRRAGFVD